MRKTEKVYFGSRPIFREYCNDCGGMALVVSGRLQCCDKLVETPEDFTIKREVSSGCGRGITAKIKARVLDDQDNRCIYCDCFLGEHQWDEKRQEFRKDKVHYDHFDPWSYSGNNEYDNIVASCPLCNLFKSDKIFADIQEARIYIKHRREQREKERAKKGHM